MQSFAPPGTWVLAAVSEAAALFSLCSSMPFLQSSIKYNMRVVPDLTSRSILGHPVGTSYFGA